MKIVVKLKHKIEYKKKLYKIKVIIAKGEMREIYINIVMFLVIVYDF